MTQLRQTGLRIIENRNGDHVEDITFFLKSKTPCSIEKRKKEESFNKEDACSVMIAKSHRKISSTP